MGELIRLRPRESAPEQAPVEEAPARRLGPRQRARFFFDLACPFSYLGIELAERVLGQVEWVPVSGEALRPTPPHARRDGIGALRAKAEAMANQFGTPMIWPETFPAQVPGALRAAVVAEELGAGGRFAAAASRLAFCGGFDLEDPVVLADAAGAAALEARDILLAAEDDVRDDELMLTALTLRERRVRRLPAIRLRGRWYSGRDAFEILAPEHVRVSVPARGD